VDFRTSPATCSSHLTVDHILITSNKQCLPCTCRRGEHCSMPMEMPGSNSGTMGWAVTKTSHCTEDCNLQAQSDPRWPRRMNAQLHGPQWEATGGPTRPGECTSSTKSKSERILRRTRLGIEVIIVETNYEFFSFETKTVV
jgi:hypothetical protein